MELVYKYLTYGLVVQYVLAALPAIYMQKWGAALYWASAAGVTLGVIYMGK